MQKMRPSGTNKESRLAYVVAQINKWRAILLGLIVCAGIVVTTIGHAQEDDEDLPVFRTELQETIGDVHEQIREQQAQDNLERYQQIVEESRAAKADLDQFIDEVRLTKALSKFNTRIALNPQMGNRYSVNYYGANYSVPNGSHRGDGLVGINEFWITNVNGSPVARDRTITRGRPGDRSLGSGWNFEPVGFLKETYQTVDVTLEEGGVTRCTVALRYTYASANGGSNFQQRGIEQPIIFDLQGDVGADICAGAAVDHFVSRPTQFWSNDGQIALDLQNPNQPFMRYPDGTTLTLGLPTPEAAGTAYIPFNEDLRGTIQSGEYLDRLWYPSQNISRNGQITTYTYDRTTGWLGSVTDFRGRVTQYDRDPGGRVKTITAPGPGGGLLTWQMTWNTFNWNPSSVFPDIPCLSNGRPAGCPTSDSYTTLTSLQLPDSRSYSFAYGPWGNLKQVNEPDGAVRVFEYGDSTTSAFMPPGGLPGTFGNLPAYTLNLQRRRVTTTTIYPQGISNPDDPNPKPSYTTTFRHENTEDLNEYGECQKLNWIKRTQPNGDVGREAICNSFSYPALAGKTFAQEIWRGGSLVSATYYGNLGTFGDTSVRVGDMYVDRETASALAQSGGFVPFLDVRPNKVVHFKDGVMWTEELKYEQSEIEAREGFRTTGNVTIKRVRDASDVLISKSETTYFHNERLAYIARNLLRLPSSMVLKDGMDHILTRAEYGYDQSTAMPSGAPNLDTSMLNVRGNATTVKSYLDAANAGLPVTTETRYFDTGDVQQTFDPLRKNPTTSSYTFGLCSNNPLLTNTVANVRGHQTQTVSDCFSGLTLKVTDPNGQTAYAQYDVLGRLFETAGPGDTLTAIAGLIRDPNIPPGRLAGSILGNYGQGPTTWNQYFRLGIEVSDIYQQRTVTHRKDGTDNGSYVKTFVDGLGRTMQTRAEVDPNFSGGNSENVATIEYDNMGQVSKSYVPCFSSASDAVTVSCTSLSTTRQYDALARETSVTAPGSLTTTTRYDGAGTQWLTTVTDPNLNLSKVFTDVLGRTVKTSRHWVEGAGACSDPDPLLGANWCSTTMDYDVAGRLTSTTDPGGKVMSFIYDGLGRKTDMTDPDMGHWHYVYDDNGNLTSQTDAKGQVIKMYYDDLNRISRKDLPPTDVPGEEDVTYFYDGAQPPTCYSCNDHCDGTLDTCDTATGTCVHTLIGPPCDGGPPPSPTPTPTPQTPFPGPGPHNVPGITQAEDFDNGGEGVAYHDNDAGSSWGAYRTNVDVDIYGDSNASGGFAIGNAQPGEWLEYSVNVNATGSYDLVARVASPGGGMIFHYVIDPESANVITPQVLAPATGSWNTYGDAQAARVSLSQGPHIIRIAVDQNGANLDRLNITAASPSSSPVGYWKFDENSGGIATDSSVNNNGGTLVNMGANPWISGRVGISALNFDGVDDYVQVGDRPSLSATTGLTMAAWIKPAVGGVSGTIMNKEGEYEVSLINGELAWAISNTSPGFNWRYAGQWPAIGVWTHVAVTYDGSNIKTYVDGVERNSQPGYGNIFDNYTPENDFRIGSRQCGICNEYFKGGIDEVQVYSRPLSAAEVQALATAGVPPPTVPGNLTATASSISQINLSWNASSNHTGYVLEQSLTSGSGFIPIVNLAASATSYPNTGLSGSTTYYYRIKSTNGTQQSGYSNQASATTLGAPPIAPSGLTAAAFSNSGIGLTWQDNSNNEDGFKIERSPNGVNNFVQIAIAGANSPSYTDNNLMSSTTYYYRVRASNGAGDSGYTNVASATTLATNPPVAPTGLTAAAAGSSQINLQWSDNSNNETGFVVERYSVGLAAWIEVGWPGPNINYFWDSGLPSSTSLSYRVKAINAGGSSAYSNTATATTLPGNDTPVAPSSLQATAVSGTKARLTWLDNSNNEFGFAVERNSGAGFVNINYLGQNTTSYADTILSPGITYSYRVKALTSGACCDSAYSNVATITTPSYFSLAVNGSQWLQVPSSPTIDIDSSALTVEAWIKTDCDYRTTVCPAQDIISRFNPTATGVNGGYELWIGNSGKLNFAVYKNGANFGQVTSDPQWSPIPIRGGVWHHVAGVYNPVGGTLSVYVDGVRTGNAIASNVPRSGTSPLMIGKSNDPNSTSWFRGKIDEVRISAEAVYTGSSIVNYFSLAHLPPRPGGTTRALWNFDARSVADSSGNNNTGALNGGADFSPDVPDFTVAMNFGFQDLRIASYRLDFLLAASGRYVQ